jgi:hypothetical protein
MGLAAFTSPIDKIFKLEGGYGHLVYKETSICVQVHSIDPTRTLFA